VVAHRARQFGKSKYGFNRTVKFFLDPLTVWFLTKYGQRPQHFFGTMGLIMLLFGIAFHCFQIFWNVFFVLPSIRNLIESSSSEGILSYNAVSTTSLWINALTPHSFCLMPIFAGMTFIALGLVAESFVAKTIQPERGYDVKKEI
jgi:hypothetical protein